MTKSCPALLKLPVKWFALHGSVKGLSLREQRMPQETWKKKGPLCLGTIPGDQDLINPA